MNKTLFSLIVCAVFPAAVQADGIPVKPGLWEMNMSMQMPMLAAPQVRIYTECVEETEFNADDIKMSEDETCTVNEMEVDGDTARWSIECPNEMGVSRGHWSVTSEGDSMHGEGTMSTDMGGMKMEFSMAWEGKRIGDCEE